MLPEGTLGTCQSHGSIHRTFRSALICPKHFVENGRRYAVILEYYRYAGWTVPHQDKRTRVPSPVCGCVHAV
eukprot:1763913-Prymnesium_polylepis.1